MTMILIVIGQIGIILKGLIKELEDLKIRENAETIHAAARILIRALVTGGDLLSSDFGKRLPVATNNNDNDKLSAKNKKRTGNSNTQS